MTAYTIVNVNDQVREWKSGKGTPFKSYRVTLKHPDGRELGNVEVSRPADMAAPKVGDSVEGTVDQSGQYGPKLQEPRKGGGGGRAKSPEERRSIAMQSSNQRGVEVVQIAAAAGAFSPSSLDDVIKAAALAADTFYQRVIKAEAGT